MSNSLGLMTCSPPPLFYFFRLPFEILMFVFAESVEFRKILLGLIGGRFCLQTNLKPWDIFIIPSVLILARNNVSPLPPPPRVCNFLKKGQAYIMFIPKYVRSLVSVINGFFLFYFLAVSSIQDSHQFLCIQFAFIFLLKLFNSWIFAESFVATNHTKLLVLSLFSSVYFILLNWLGVQTKSS